MNKLNKKRRQFIFISLLIPVTLLIAFVVFPAIDLFRMSFTDWDGFSADYHFINFENYISMFHNKDLWLSLRNNAVYFVLFTLFSILCRRAPGFLFEHSGEMLRVTISYHFTDFIALKRSGPEQFFCFLDP